MPNDWTDPLASIDTRSPDAVCALLAEAAEANLTAACRKGSVDEIEPEGTLLATGDLHDNPAHLAAAVRLSGILDESDAPRHVTLHEVIHGGNFVGGMDTSHRALLRVAALKRQYPESVHTLLANHELSQIVGAGIVKDGVRVVDAFNEGVQHVYGDEAGRVLEGIGAFIRSMPVALVSGRGTGKGVLCAHSLPSPRVMERFDTGVLNRPILGSDYEPRVGAVHQMVWGETTRRSNCTPSRRCGAFSCL